MQGQRPLIRPSGTFSHEERRKRGAPSRHIRLPLPQGEEVGAGGQGRLLPQARSAPSPFVGRVGKGVERHRGHARPREPGLIAGMAASSGGSWSAG